MILTGNLPNTQTDILTVPVGKQYAIVSLLFANTSTSVDEMIQNMWIVKNGDSVSANNIVITNMPITATETFSYPNKILLEAGDKITAQSTNGTISFHISFMEI